MVYNLRIIGNSVVIGDLEDGSQVGDFAVRCYNRELWLSETTLMILGLLMISLFVV